ncbi:polysaccharide deacetylase family protein [Rhodococcus erythropolis]|uniref:polysaccharide deacetylase family protein n=1 Tax=Rhodococcus erythropolis TaxID=1833 RepID=UPI002227BA2E|nr:polysaccharide deacetylase family protein [Rhodococcus erythropolis]MCW2295379.1 peptidoglycan/xylan/chitin deacetylase (PgdA/CDA1 family) [Rhodococcus erythropolis]
MGRLVLPEGKTIVVNIGTDLDAQSVWMGGFGMITPATMARGQFCAEVGTPRLLRLYSDYAIKTTFFIPAHTVETWPEVCTDVLENGHEVGHHGFWHENPRLLGSRDVEKGLMERALLTYQRKLGIRPVGYRNWDPSEYTLDLLEEYGFRYDSSLMARDLEVHRPQRWQVRWNEASRAGRSSSVLEMPVSWSLDDWPGLGHEPGGQSGFGDPEVWLRRHKTVFDFAYENVQNACYSAVVHPQLAGQAVMMPYVRALLEYISGHDGVWFATLADAAECWVDDEEDLRQMEGPDYRGVEPKPL